MSVSQTNASIPIVAPMPWTRRSQLAGRQPVAQRRERILDPADAQPAMHRQRGAVVGRSAGASSESRSTVRISGS